MQTIRRVLNKPAAQGRGDRGAAAVEFALILPLLLAVTFGLIQYGVYFWGLQGASAAARDAARQGAVGKPVSCNDFRNLVRQGLTGTTVDAAGATITRTFNRKPGQSKVEIGDRVRISISAKSMDLALPFIPFINDGVVQQTAESRVDFVPDPNIADCP